MKLRFLGGLTPREFLRRHWQKRPLYVRAALPQCPGILDERTLTALAARGDVESRMVERRGNRRNAVHGPFGRNLSLKRINATLLVSGVNLHVGAAERLLRRFSFIPQARLDDVMVSYATPGGGVGPHVDSYDVFLLQGPGRRRWRLWSPDLSRQMTFEAKNGDLLYVPPGWKHDGVALEACFTYSIGFRAPRGAELGAAFLDFLHERGLPDAAYRDPRLAPCGKPARLPGEMLKFAQRSLRRIRWSRGDVERFLGEYLTMPKAHLVFRGARTRRDICLCVVRLDPATQLLYSGRRFFINGETVMVAGRYAIALRGLADRRSAPGGRLAAPPLAGLISGWQRLGYLHLERQ